MSALRKVVPVSQIVFGTDYPFRTSIEHVMGLKECGVFNAQEVRAIERENALKFLPRHKAWFRQQNVREGHHDSPVGSAHDPTGGGRPATPGDVPSTVLPMTDKVGIDYPDIRDAELKIVVQTVLHRGDGVIRGHHFDANVWGRREDFLIRERIFANHHVRESDAAGRDSHPDFGDRLKAREFRPAAKPDGDPSLRVGMPSFSHVSLQELAIDEIAIGVKAGAQVFVHRNHRAYAHEFII